MQSALVIRRDGAGWAFQPPAALPVAALMLGRPVAEAAALLPRLFNLCAAAQAMALRLALGLPAPAPEALRIETLRDHLLKLCVIWPRLLGLTPLALPRDWADPARVNLMVWGRAEPPGFDDWLASGEGLAPVLTAIAAAFAPGEAVAELPLSRPETALLPVAQENSVAARHAAAPALQGIAARFGRGPFWRAAGVIHDIAALQTGRDPCHAVQIQADLAIVPAARGAYAVQARAASGLVTAFARCTPTDHLCAPGGILTRTLDSLPPQKATLLPLVIDILSPCVEVQLPQPPVHHA